MKEIICLLLFSCVSSVQAQYELSLQGKRARQSETWSDRVADLAIDGNANTFSVAASPTNPSVLGWWEVDLGGNYRIGQVVVTASNEDYNAKYLQYFSIWLLDESRNQNLCYQYLSSVSLSPKETRSFPCQNDLFSTRYVRIARLGGQFRPDGISLAEVKVILRAPERLVQENVAQTWSKIDTRNMATSHCNTWGNHYSDLAIDNNLLTWSICCLACDKTNIPGPGWWQIDLGSQRPITGVEIISSSNEYDANYLQSIIGAVSSINTTDLNHAQICFTFNSDQNIRPSQNLTFKCNVSPTWGRYFFIIRNPSSYLRMDIIALAEIKIFEVVWLKSNSPVNQPSNIFSTEANGYEISLGGLKTHQTHAWGNHYSYLAVDNNYDTYSIACVKCDKTLSGGVGWWQIDFGYERPIGGVKLTSSKDQYNSDYLQDIIISLTSINTTDLSSARICYDFSNSSTIPAGSTLIFNCVVRPTWGRFLLVSRKTTAKFRPDAIAIAEFKAFEAAPTVPPVPIIAVPNKIVPKSAMVAVQSGTVENHVASHGIDGNPDTFFSALNSFLVPGWSAVAWWQVDLGSMYRVIQVDITSSRVDAFARHLESFSIDVYPKSVFEDPNLPGVIQCAYYPGTTYIQPGTTEQFVCRAANYGRYVIIRKIRDFTTSVERLSAAEVTIHYA